MNSNNNTLRPNITVNYAAGGSNSGGDSGNANKPNVTNRISPNSFLLDNSSSSSAFNTHLSSTSMLDQSSKMDSFKRNIPANSSFKDLKKSYHLKKKYFTRNIQSAIDSTQEIHSGWLKARTTFKRWTKVWCQVKPGYLIMYTTQEAQKKHRLGVVLLSVCQVMKRPTKKEGFCFKLLNPFGVSVWAKSSTRALAFSQASLTLRASDDSVGKLWLEALNKCNLSINLEGYQPIIEDAEMVSNRTSDSDDDDGDQSTRHMESIMLDHTENSSNTNSISSKNNNNCQMNTNPTMNGGYPSRPINTNLGNTTTLAKHTSNDHDIKNAYNNDRRLRDSSSAASHLGKNIISNNHRRNIPLNRNADVVRGNQEASDLNPAKLMNKLSKYCWTELQLENVKYVLDGAEELGSVGVQSEDVHESNKSFLWHIIKQLRPGMDLSKVTLPTFILEPRSFLEKLADYYYHCDILSDAVSIDNPVSRLINIVKWYLSGFYKKPKGPKKPYNPILGEKFRCFWDHPKTQSRTFFIAEQVSHHPPISAFHVSNRKDGYTITCALLSRSKYGGNSVSAILDGKARLHLTGRNETYILTMPFANCRGILLGSLCLELGGKVEISCVETKCKCELDFKLAAVWANSNSYNTLTGKIFDSNKVTHTLEGHWDKKITIIDKKTEEKSILWEATDQIRNSRLKRYTVALKDQGERESVRLWSKVSEALLAGDQIVATTEKTILEDMQRREARERRDTFAPIHFTKDPEKNEWHYKWQDNRVWYDQRDIMQFEDDFKIRTLILTTERQQSLPSTLSTQNKNQQPAIDHDPIIDLPITKINKFTEKFESLGVIKPASSSNGYLGALRASTSKNDSDEIQFTPDKFKSIESNFDLMSQAIKRVTEANKKLENEVATLKKGKKAVAFIIGTIIVAVLSWYFNYFSY